MKIDLGGCMKGYAVDCALDILRAHNVKAAMVNLGGNLGFLGKRDKSWKIGIQNPFGNGIIKRVKLEGGNISTSGSYYRNFTIEGKKYSHIMDPRSGFPVNECASATVVADIGLKADILSTAVFVLGPEKGLKLIERLNKKIDSSIGCVIIDRNDKFFISEELKGSVW